MTELFKAKVRRVGSSLGVLIPREKIREINFQEGDELELALLPHTKDFSGFGIARRARVPFLRDKKVRRFL